MEQNTIGWKATAHNGTVFVTRVTTAEPGTYAIKMHDGVIITDRDTGAETLLYPTERAALVALEQYILAQQTKITNEMRELAKNLNAVKAMRHFR
jgi:hypothetical protein